MRSRSVAWGLFSSLAALCLFAFAPSCADIGNGGPAAQATGGAGLGGSGMAGSGLGGSAAGASASGGKGATAGSSASGGTTSSQGGAAGSSGASAGGSTASGGSAQAGTGNGGQNAGGAAAGGQSAGGQSAGGQSAGGQSGGSGGDAGSPTGRDLSPDRTKFFGQSRCAGSTLQLCEDFESGTIDPSLWTVRGTKPVIDGVQKARGAKAMHIHVKSELVDGGGGYVSSGLLEKKTFPAPSNRYFGRMFVYFQSIPVPSGAFTFSHWTIIGGSGTGTKGDIRVSAFLQNGKDRFGVGTDSGTDPAGTGDWTTLDDDPKGAFKPIPTGEWECIEWMNDGEHEETAFYWDAVEHPSMHTTSTVHGGNAANPYVLPTFTQTWMGFEVYQGGGEDYEMWVDEIAIDPERIGCVY